MKLIIIYVLIVFPICICFAQQNLYLKKNETGHLKKLRKKSILTFETSDYRMITGRIIAVSDSSFRLSTYDYKRKIKPDTVNVHIKSVSRVIKKLTKKEGKVGAIIGKIGLIGILGSTVTFITETPKDAQEFFQVSVGLFGVGAILHAPHRIKRKFNINNEWTLVVK